MVVFLVRELRRGADIGEEFWRADGNEVCQIDVVSHSGLTHFSREPGDLQNTLDKIAPRGKWHLLKHRPGEYFPRMARPDSIRHLMLGRNPDPSDEFQHSRARSTGQLHAFIEELDKICRVVHPEGANLSAFGHATRNLLILACTEVEAQWKKILDDNHYKGKKSNGRFDTRDYVKLSPAMRLGQFVVNLNYYPWLAAVAPFRGWRSNGATKSLDWYEAYNKVKHDRERNFAEATLERTLTAVTACFVMLCGQYGWDFALQEKEAERAFFRLVTGPEWSASEIYVPPFEASYQPRPYPFDK